MWISSKNSSFIFTTNANSKTMKNSILGKNTTSKDYKDLSYIIYFNHNKKSHYESICTKLKENLNTLDS